MEITAKNYAKEIEKLVVPNDLKEDYDGVKEFTQNYTNWELYNTEKDIKEWFDLYFKKLSEANIKPLITPPKKASKSIVKKEDKPTTRKVNKKTSLSKTKDKTDKSKSEKVVFDKEKVKHFSEEYKLIRRFYNLTKKEVEFRQVQLLYMSFSKVAVNQKVRKASASDLFKTVSDKVAKLFALMKEKKATKIKELVIKEKGFEKELEGYVKSKEIDTAVKLMNRFINIQGTKATIKKTETLLKAFDNAISNNKIAKTNNLYEDVVKAKNVLNSYLENKQAKVDVTKHSLNGINKENRITENKLNSLGFISASETPKEAQNIFRLKGSIGDFIQDVQPHQALIIIKGTKHTSKSQLAMQISNGFAENNMKVAYIDYEQGGLECKDTIDSLNRNTSKQGRERIYVKGYIENPMQELHNICGFVDVIVADSVTDLGITADELNELRKTHPKTIWCFISQVKENGSMYGGNKMAHNPTAIIQCNPALNFEDRYATLEKNRGNDLSMCYDIYKMKTFKFNEKGEREYL